jgi:ubiquinone/menaquinone biosynthesis C-methylase UbiE
MNEFDLKASVWDLNPMHVERSVSISREIIRRIPLNKDMRALEYGAGTGITSFFLKDHLKEITMMDSSSEMVKIMNEKILAGNNGNLKALVYDLEQKNWNDLKFDLIFNQMVLHHVNDVNRIITKFSDMINQGGFLAVADLYPEDGSFHGSGFTGHRGFDPIELSDLLSKNGFEDITTETCYTINKMTSENQLKKFDLFLMVAKRS